MSYTETLNLPTTAFPMKADLPTLEPSILTRWDALDLYGRLREVRAERQAWILHDGPPYANGHIHIGHALNKILKDVVVRSQSMFGYNATYVPGRGHRGPEPARVPRIADRRLGALRPRSAWHLGESCAPPRLSAWPQPSRHLPLRTRGGLGHTPDSTRPEPGVPTTVAARCTSL